LTLETTDVVVIGSGFGGAIPAYHLAAGGARVVVLERGPRLRTEDFGHSLRVDQVARMVDLIQGDGITVVAGNCVGGSSVSYFAASLRAPAFIFERRGSIGRRIWPAALTRAALDPWYDRVEAALPVARQDWTDVSYAGGLFAAACNHAGRTCNPTPVAVALNECVNCNWMLTGCRFDAKRSMLLNYLPAAESHGASIRPLHEVQLITPAAEPGYRYRVDFTVVDPDDYRRTAGAGSLVAKVVVLAGGAVGTPVILQRSAALLGGVPASVGRHFSGNGDRVSVAVIDDAKVRSVLGLSRAPGVGYQAMPIGKPINTTCYDHLDPGAPEFTRFSLQQIYFPSVTNILGQAGGGDWFGVTKKGMRSQWRSWLTLLAMTEDDNEGTFGVPPPTGSFNRLAPALGLGTMRFRPTANTRRGWAAADAELAAIITRDGIGTVAPWSTEVSGAVTAHPLGSCRIGDDPATSALTDSHELRGQPGIFVTDAAAVPTSLTVNPSLTVAALAERASPAIIARAREYGVAVKYAGTLPTH
jgi:choline dehydrogenase-like flavoprotein